MSGNRTSIYRASAYENHLRARQAPTLARIATPRSLSWLWILTLCLLAILVTTGLVRIPIFSTVPGFAAERETPAVGGEEMVLVILAPAPCQQAIKVGSEVLVHQEDGGRLPCTILRVEPSATSPAHLRERFAASLPPEASFSAPVVVAYAHLPSGAGGSSPQTLRGASFEVDIQVGTRRVLSLLPGAGRLLD